MTKSNDSLYVYSLIPNVAFMSSVSVNFLTWSSYRLIQLPASWIQLSVLQPCWITFGTSPLAHCTLGKALLPVGTRAIQSPRRERSAEAKLNKELCSPWTWMCCPNDTERSHTKSKGAAGGMKLSGKSFSKLKGKSSPCWSVLKRNTESCLAQGVCTWPWHFWQHVSLTCWILAPQHFKNPNQLSSVFSRLDPSEVQSTLDLAAMPL